jgi:DNA mismatch repair protein MutH
MASQTYKTKNQLYKKAQEILNKNIRQFIPPEEIAEIEEKIEKYAGSRKWFLWDLIEVYLFGIPNNGRAEADFQEAGVELKTTPIKKHNKHGYSAKERLVFSMIDYMHISGETWEKSSFLRKNKVLLLMFYLYLKDENILDSNFKHITLLDLLSDISSEDIFQIKKDWEFIRNKIARWEAHLLSEGDTYYLGACTKSRNSSITRKQPWDIAAKPRAFSLKPTYINYLLQKNILHKEDKNAISLVKKNVSIEDAIWAKFKPFLGKSDNQISKSIWLKLNRKTKNYKRIIANMILGGTASNKIVELEKAEITLRAITLEPSGTLKESISFPIFDYREIIHEEWYNSENGELASFHEELDRRKFLFVVFQKQKWTKDVILRRIKFWNFPLQDLEEAKKVFEKTKKCIQKNDYKSLPKIKENNVSHVRPHWRNKKDTQITPQWTRQIKRCFWLNAKYIQKAIENN